MSAQRIFVGGTGRSGTTILLRLLGRHRRVHPLSLETRFIVDPDGLSDLARNLTEDYSPVRSREALYRFERMMRQMAEPGRDPYRGYDMAALCGREFYFRRLEQLLAELADFEYSGRDLSTVQAEEPRLVKWARSLDAIQRRLRKSGRVLPPSETPRRRFRHGRYFGDCAQLAAVLAAYVDDLFRTAAALHGKGIWCEKTPHNLSHLRFIRELFADAPFIHILRDPRAVARSLMKQPWAPDTANDCSRFVRGIYDAWFDYRARNELPAGYYLEVRLETLTAQPTQTLAAIAQFLGLENDFETLPEIRAEHEADWRQGLSANDISTIESSLTPYAQRLGYGSA